MTIARLGGEMELRSIEGSDTNDLYALVQRNVEHLRPWMTWIDSADSRKDIAAFVAGAQAALQARTAYQTVIRVHGQSVGIIDLHQVDWQYRSARIGYWLDKAHTGRGIMTRAARAMTQYGFDTLELHRIEIHVATENRASRSVAERLGYRLEGVLRDAQRIRDRYLDHALYAMLSRDWPASQTL